MSVSMLIEGGVSYQKFGTDEMAAAARRALHSDLSDPDAKALRQAVTDRGMLLDAIRDALGELATGDGPLGAAILREAVRMAEGA